MAAMIILAVGLLVIVGIERKTARSYADAKRAELAARAGMEEVRALLRAETANDDFLIIAHTPHAAREQDREPLPGLYIARGEPSGDSVRHRYLPLFSTASQPDPSNTLAAPDSETLIGEDPVEFRPRPWADAARIAWIPVEDKQGRLVGRYAYWVEDLQGKIDARSAGNDDGGDGGHARNAWPFPAPGLNPEPLSEDELKLDRVAIHALDPASGDRPAGDLTKRIIDGRGRMISPDSLLAAAGYQAPLERGENGLLNDATAAALEKNASPILRAYKERPTVPFAAGISSDIAGEPKLNLNRLLARPRSSAIDDFADWIDRGLPDFVNRKGGFPEDYLRTLAANAFDYADADNEPTLLEGAYRGLDGYPLVSEYMLALKWENVDRRDGRTYAVISVAMFIELWNMTDQLVEGTAQISYDTRYSMSIGAIPDINIGDPELVMDPETSTTDFVQLGDGLWSPQIAVSLRPNEFRVFKAGEAVLRIDAGPESLFIPSPLEVLNDDNVTSGYRLRWNGEVVDHARGKQRRYDQQLHYPGNNATNSAQKVSATIPGHSYKPKTEIFANNMGDPRMSAYITAPQDANSWPQNYSPNRRTIRWGSIYSEDSATKRRHYGRVLPAEWPDGGHNSAYGSNAFFTTDRRMRPDDPRFFASLPTPIREQAPMRLSNLGRFYSATELGRVYDPVMWYPTYGDISGSSGSGSRDTATHNAAQYPTLPTSRISWPDVERNSPANPFFGGGNTLRIGRPEHPRFEEPGLHAAHLLDLFHAGESTSRDDAEREGDLVEIRGHVNVNTAGRDALRALAAGMLAQDPALCIAPSKNHQTSTLMAPLTAPLELGTPTRSQAADRIAEAILRSRPFASAADLASARDDSDKPVFGNRDMYAQGQNLQWTDSAAEEVFARVYDASTFRSRNFRVWVIGQAMAPPRFGSGDPEILAESRKVFTLFADPGERSEDGSIDASSYRPIITYENDF